MRTRLLVVNVGSSPKADIASRHVSPPLRAITASYVGSSLGCICRSIGSQRSAQASASRRLSVIALRPLALSQATAAADFREPNTDLRIDAFTHSGDPCHFRKLDSSIAMV